MWLILEIVLKLMGTLSQFSALNPLHWLFFLGLFVDTKAWQATGPTGISLSEIQSMEI